MYFRIVEITLIIMNNILDILSIGSIFAGILVITSSNPVVSVLFLVTVFVLVSCNLLTINISFVGLSYLIVYVGAVALLFLFVVIILNIRVSEINPVNLEGPKNMPLGLFVGTLFILEIVSILPAKLTIFTQATAYYLNLKINVNVAFTGTIADTGFTNFSQIQALGQGLYTHGSLGLVLASFVLLLAILGPVLICIRSNTIIP